MRERDDTRVVVEIASRQLGLVTVAQLAARGIDARQVERWVAQGWLHRIHVGVYAVGHRSIGVRGRWLAATLALDGAAISHRTAAQLWGLLDRPGRWTHVTVGRATGHPHRDGLRVHRAGLPARHCATRHGIRATSVARTLLDLAATETPRTLDRAFEAAQVAYGVRPAAMAEEVVLHPGRRGIARLRTLLADAVDPGLVESRLELRFLRFCRDHRLPRPRTQVPVGAWRVDFLFAEAQLVVETDGRRYHWSIAARRRDRAKDGDLHGLGLRVVRLRWADVVDHPAATAEGLRVALSVASSSP